jgi:hypothetical protein
VPRGGKHFVQSLVPFPGEGAFVGFQHFLEAVAYPPVGPVEMARYDKQYRQRQVMVGRIRQP